MKVIFEKNKVSNKIIYDFKTFDGDTTILKKLKGRIHAGCLNMSEIEMKFDRPLQLIDENKVLGLFLKTESDTKFKVLTMINDEKIEIEIIDGIDYTKDYEKMMSEIELLELEIQYAKSEDEKKFSQKELDELRDECKNILEPTVYDEINYDEYFDSINDFMNEKKSLKKIGITAGIIAGISIGFTILRKLKK